MKLKLLGLSVVPALIVSCIQPVVVDDVGFRVVSKRYIGGPSDMCKKFRYEVRHGGYKPFTLITNEDYKIGTKLTPENNGTVD